MPDETISDRTGRSRRTLLWVGVALLIVGALLWFLFYGLAMIKESLIRSNQGSARATLATINQALQAYYEKHEGYPDSLERLRGGEEGNPGTAPPERARLLETALARDDFEKNGYQFGYQPGPADQRWAATVRLFTGYRLTAEPTSPGSSGQMFYYTDWSGEIHAKEMESAGPDDPVVK
ncbi:MAG: type II secretion system protein [Candidatus Acidoferrales bacterium]